MSRDIILSLIDPDPGQPRKHFQEIGIKELAQSMAENGLVQPIMVRPSEGPRYVIVHGERRWQAAKWLGWEYISAEVREVTPDEAHWLSLVENLQRSDLSPIEEANAYSERLEEGLTQEQLGQRIGKTQSYIAQKLRLLRLPDDVQLAIANGEITEGHARQLLRLNDGAAQSSMCRKAVDEEWTVMRVRLEVDEAMKQWPPDSLAGFVIRDFEQSGKSHYENHNESYPEELFPDTFLPPERVAYVPMASIVKDPNLDVRIKRDPSYAEWLSQIFITLPPVAVFQINGQYFLSDGWYRVMAAQLRSLKDIEARIYKGSFETALLYAAVANSRHGLALSQRELGRSVLTLGDVQNQRQHEA